MELLTAELDVHSDLIGSRSTVCETQSYTRVLTRLNPSVSKVDTLCDTENGWTIRRPSQVLATRQSVDPYSIDLGWSGERESNPCI